jgi:uncharacterized membrane protein
VLVVEAGVPARRAVARATAVITRLGQTRQDPDSVAAKKIGMAQPVKHPKPPKLADERTSLNDKVANFIATTLGSMWMFYASVIGFAIWMAGLGVTVAGDHYPYNLMLLAVGGIMQWLAMIAILVAQNAQGNVQDKQVEHLHDLGVTTHRLVVENTELTEAIHDHLMKKSAS